MGKFRVLKFRVLVECRNEGGAEAAYTREMLDTGKVYHYDHEDRHRERGRKKHMGANGGADR